MKTDFPAISQIALKDWLEYHPYTREVPSDRFYMNLSNDIRHEMLLFDASDSLVESDYKYLACTLACYLEDTVSEAGLWTSFVYEHKLIYGKYLPFFDISGYKFGELNLVDVQFLVWNFRSSLPMQNHFVDPFSIENLELSRLVYGMLLDALPEAPKNGELLDALYLLEDANFDTVTELVDFFTFGCYLHQYYTVSLLEREIIDVRNLNAAPSEFDDMVYDRRMKLLFSTVSPLLAMRPAEMLANRSGRIHPLYDKLTSQLNLMEGSFIYEGKTSLYLKMKHIESGTVYDVNDRGWNFPLIAGKTVIRASIVQWDGKWHAIGMAFPLSETAKLKLTAHEKSTPIPLITHHGIIRRAEECFLELCNNMSITIIESKQEAFSFIDRLWDMYHLKYGMDSTDRRMFDVYSLTFGVDDDLENLAVFFNPRAGVEFYPDMASCLSIPENIYYNTSAEADIESLMLDERVSSDFILFLIKNRIVEIEPVSGSGGFHYVWDNCDFLLRYWKREKYATKPVISIKQ